MTLTDAIREARGRNMIEPLTSYVVKQSGDYQVMTFGEFLNAEKHGARMMWCEGAKWHTLDGELRAELNDDLKAPGRCRMPQSDFARAMKVKLAISAVVALIVILAR